MSNAREIIEKLDVWVSALAAPTGPPRAIPEGDDALRLEFRQQIPHTVMIAKLIRVVGGIRAALLLAEAGYIAECAALLRMVSDFCMEVRAIGHALSGGGSLPLAVQKFVDQYFTPKSRTPEAYEAAERTRYVNREELMKATPLAAGAGVDPHQLRIIRRFLNMTFDAYVHGAYETTMELWNPTTGSFEMRGHPSASKRQEFIEAVFHKLHEAVVAVELTAAVTSHAAVFQAARDTRHSMDASGEWTLKPEDAPT